MEQIKVFIRVRPLNRSEINNGVEKIVQVPSKTEIILYKNKDDSGIEYKFDDIFDECSTQINLFRSIISPITNDIIRGYNCTLFAYGAFASGKNYTMTGNTSSSNTLGMMPRAINDLFQTLNKMNVEFNIRVTYLEIINEELVDLLSEQSSNLKLYENAKGQTKINGLTELDVSDTSEAIKILITGQERMKNRSRSHSIFTILLYIKERPSIYASDVEIIKFSKFNLVKLAGNESVYKNASDIAPRIKLNQSLMSFNRVVNSLIEKQGHVPYRDSKLTRILQESLGGNSKTSIIVTISPGNNRIEETVNTLEFAMRAKSILNRPQINERQNKTIMFKDVAAEIYRLKQNIEANRTRSGIFLNGDSYSESIDKLNQSVRCVKEQNYELEKLTFEQENICSSFITQNTNLENLIVKIDQIDNLIATLQENSDLLCKVGVQQEDTIIKLKSHENKMLDQAQSTSGVISAAIEDAKKLYKNIDKRKENDKLFEEEMSRFQADLNDRIMNIKMILARHSKTQSEMVKFYFEKYETFYRNSQAQVERFKLKSMKLRQCEQRMKSPTTEKAIEKANKIMEEMKKSSNEFFFDENMSEDEFLAKCKSYVVQFENSHNEIKQMVELRDKITVHFLEDINECFLRSMELCKGMMFDEDAIRAKLCENNAKLETMDQAIEQMKSLILQLKENNEKSKEKFVNFVVDNETKVTCNMSCVLEKVSEFQEKALETITECKFRFQCNLYSEQIGKIQHFLKEESTKQCITVANLMENRKISFRHFKKLSNTFDEEKNRNIPMQSNIRTIMNLEYQFRSLTDKLEENVIATIFSNSKLSELNSQLFKNVEQGTDLCSSKVSNFKEKEMLKYIPTGSTPVKRSYKVNINLASTTPLKNIENVQLDVSCIDDAYH